MVGLVSFFIHDFLSETTYSRHLEASTKTPHSFLVRFSLSNFSMVFAMEFEAYFLWLLLVPPSLSILYALILFLFLPPFHECTFTSVLPTLVARISFGIAVGAIAYGLIDGDKPPLEVWIVLIVASWTISVFLLWRSYHWLVQGGPPPKLTNLENRMYVVTGANAGIGKETCHQLAERGAKVIMACRSMTRGRQAREDILKRNKDLAASQLSLVEMDLANLESIRKAAELIEKEYPRIDGLVNNAGLMMDQLQTTVDGMELVMQANHVGHYLFTRLLLEQYKSIQTIVILTSSTYQFAERMDVDDMFCKNRPYTLFGQYAQSKLANLLFCRELRRRFPSLNIQAVHPGLVQTQVTRNMPAWLRLGYKAFGWFLACMQKTGPQGAWGTIHAVTLEEDDPSSYYWVNRQPQPLAACALDDESALKLYKVTAECVGLTEEDNGRQKG